MNKKILLIVIPLLIFAFCTDKPMQIDIPEESAIVGLATPIELNTDTTVVYLNDFFPDVSVIDYVHIEHLDYKLSDDKKKITLIAPETDFPKLLMLKVYVNNFTYSVLVKKSKKIKHEYVFDPKGKEYDEVSLVGDINLWNPANTPLRFEDEVWKTGLELEPGKYNYRVVLDGKWLLDPNNPDSVSNNMGGYNSVMTIGKPGKSAAPHLFTKVVDSGKVILGMKNQLKDVIVFWENFHIISDHVNKRDSKIVVPILDEAKNRERSYIRIWAYNEEGISNDILIPLHYGKPLENPADLKRMDKEAMIIYNIMVDRFYNGNPENDEPLNSPEVLPKADFHGGDIAGVTKKHKDGYFDEIGVNTIWISPIVKNPKGAYGNYPEPKTKFSAYHGYWPISFTKIDERFGTPDELHELVNTLHKDNANILLDFVANHVHELHPVYQKHKDWATDLYLPDGTLNTEKWDEHRLTTWFDTFLPTLELRKPEVYNMLTDSAVFWLDEYELDGFRHDATKHIPEVFWRTLTLKIKKQIVKPENKRIYQIGETYGTPELISSYVNCGQLDAQFDFNVYDAAINVFARDDKHFDMLESRLKQSLDYYGYHNLMGNISGNQDRARFISYADGSVSFKEDAKKAGWTRKIDVQDPVGYEKLKLLFAFNMTIPGIPVIFYGDEIGMPGGNDPDNRRMMQFEDLAPEQQELKETVAALAKFRRSNIPLIFGDYKTLKVSRDVFVYARTYFDNIVIVALNKSGEKKSVEFEIPERFANSLLASPFGEPKITVEGTKVIADVEPYDFTILGKVVE